MGLVALSLTCAVAIWAILNQQRTASLQALTSAEVDAATDLLVHDLRARILAIRHLDRPWREGESVAPEYFYSEANTYLFEYRGLRAISYADRNFIAQYIAPRASSTMIGRSIADISTEHRAALQKARDTRETTVSPPIDLVDGSGRGFLVLIPIHSQDSFEGFIAVVFNANTWLGQLLFRETPTEFMPHYASRVLLSGVPIYESADFETLNSETLSRASLPIYNATLTILAKPRPIFFDRYWNWSPEGLGVLVFVVLMAAGTLATLAQRAQRAEAQAARSVEQLKTANSQLRQEADVRRNAEKEATRAREATARFLATMSHEIRTPLNAIMGMFQLIENSDEVPERQRKQAIAGTDASRRLYAELTKVLDISRLDAGALHVQKRRCNLSRLIQKWQQSLEAFLVQADKPIAAHFDIAGDLPQEAVVDEAALTQVVHNLLDNAVKFTVRGQITLAIKRCGTDLVISVSDTGIGIPEALLPSVFDRFYQVDNGIDRTFAGTGLGLTISRDLVSLMDGKVSACNLVQQHDTAMEMHVIGAKFSVRLRSALDRRSDRAAEPAHNDTARHVNAHGKLG